MKENIKFKKYFYSGWDRRRQKILYFNKNNIKKEGNVK